MKKKKIALVHDYLNEFGGAERVLLSLSAMYPDAPIYTIYKKDNSNIKKYFGKKDIRQSWFSYLPFADKLISPLRFLVPLIWRSFDFKDYDLVITSSAWAITKGMRNAKKEISYIHTPPRYLYGYRSSRDWKNYWFAGAVKMYALVVNHFMRMYDFDSAQKPDILIANSINIQKRIKKFYRRESQVIYPPIDIKKFSDPKILPAGRQVKPNSGDYYLIGGRLVKHKNFDKIINAFSELDLNLIIFGGGVLENNLKNQASEYSNIKFLGKVSDKKLVSLYKGAKAFIVASKDEDLGMTLLEATAAGTPVIAYKAEGYLETVVENNLPAGKAGTGLFFTKLNSEAIKNAVIKNEKTKWNKKEIQKHARKFSEDEFKKNISEVVKTILT